MYEYLEIGFLFFFGGGGGGGEFDNLLSECKKQVLQLNFSR